MELIDLARTLTRRNAGHGDERSDRGGLCPRARSRAADVPPGAHEVNHESFVRFNSEQAEGFYMDKKQGGLDSAR